MNSVIITNTRTIAPTTIRYSFMMAKEGFAERFGAAGVAAIKALLLPHLLKRGMFPLAFADMSKSPLPARKNTHAHPTR